ncbi:hypothetical protein LJR034_002992 [Caballeronia sp. LjRoot34]|uniref:hypothetical protein n=1 Tax=Caballeronia sp. LjRoot34 TaxID=3342325 RepID=UPI003ED13ADE
MRSNDLAIERVKKIVDQAESLRMMSAAVPVSDLKTLLLFFDLAGTAEFGGSRQAGVESLTRRIK